MGAPDDWFTHWFDADYAALYAHRNEDEARLAVHTALRLAPELAAGPVLDLGCGSGRHLAHLRKRNPVAFGLDLSETLLGLAPPELRDWLLRGDMRSIPVRPGVLAGITMWFTPFGYFDEAQNRALLDSLSRLLKPGGVLLLDFMNAHLVRRDLVTEEVQEKAGYRVHITRSLEADRVIKQMRIHHLGTGSSREAVESVRVYEPAELLAMTGASGLSLQGEVGDYQGLPFRPSSSPRWIGIFRKPRV
nr:class I SAM-dependent methyltransferase [uncultured Holophaga sp.]